MTPTTEPAKRIAKLFNRRLTTAWSLKELRAYKVLYRDGCFLSLDDLSLIERYYFSERKKADGIHRRDLCTFLNNYPGELDRARAWEERLNEKRKLKPKRYVENEGVRPATDAEFEAAGKLARIELEKLRARFKNLSKT